MDAVHLIVLHNLPHPVHNQLLGLFACGVIGDGAVVLDGVAGLEHRCRGVFGAELGVGGAVAHPVGVQPRLQPQAAFMGLLHHNLQRVKAGVYPLLPAGQIGPGEQLRFIQRVAEGAHLGDDGVEPEGLHIVEGLLDILGKLLLTHAAVIAVQQHRL